MDKIEENAIPWIEGELNVVYFAIYNTFSLFYLTKTIENAIHNMYCVNIRSAYLIKCKK